MQNDHAKSAAIVRAPFSHKQGGIAASLTIFWLAGRL
jgi:hypothetical protein